MSNPNHTKGNTRFDGNERVTIHWQTDVGCVREANEDSFGTYVPEDAGTLANLGAMVIVADGMGGADGGATASTMAVSSMISQYFENPSPDLEKGLGAALENTNRIIHGAAHENPQYKGMGSTCTAVVVQDDNLFFAHVGDSRGYLLREHQLLQFTNDHSKVAQMVLDGYITAEEAEVHPERNVLLRSVGPKPEVKVEVGRLKLQSGDCILLCSDGLCGLVTDLEMMQLIEDFGPEATLDGLIKLAKERGGHDNITAQLVGYGAKKKGAPATLAAPVTIGASTTTEMPMVRGPALHDNKHLKFALVGAGVLIVILFFVLVFAVGGEEEKVKKGVGESDVSEVGDTRSMEDHAPATDVSGGRGQADRSELEKPYVIEIRKFLKKNFLEHSGCFVALKALYRFVAPKRYNAYRFKVKNQLGATSPSERLEEVDFDDLELQPEVRRLLEAVAQSIFRYWTDHRAELEDPMPWGQWYCHIQKQRRKDIVTDLNQCISLTTYNKVHKPTKKCLRKARAGASGRRGRQGNNGVEKRDDGTRNTGPKRDTDKSGKNSPSSDTPGSHPPTAPPM